MGATTNRRIQLSSSHTARSKTAAGRQLVGPPRALTQDELAAMGVASPAAGGPVQVDRSRVQGLQERRRRRRVAVAPMYTAVIMRVLSRRNGPLEGHVIDLSETGMAIEVDSLVPVGQAVTVEFQISGVGRLKDEQWPLIAAAAEVVRHDNLDDFPAGPYRHALRFLQISTMSQAQIARFVATQPG